MKRFKIALVILMTGLLISCSTDRDDLDLSEAEANELTLIAGDGEWRISESSFNNNETTANYNDYVFSFEDANNLSAVSSIDSVIGTWRISNDSGDEFDAYDDVDFHIFFNSSGKLGELANNYNVISATENEIKLSLNENASGNIATITFSKN